MTSTTAEPNNHGKKWTPGEDEHIMYAPELTDNHFAQLLKRSEQAIQSRRAVLAAKLHKSSGRSVQECADQLHADTGRTTHAVNNDGKGMQKTLIKPYNVTFSARNDPAHQTVKILKTPKRTSPTPPNTHPSSIASICSHIKRTDADMDEIWAMDALVPTLVQYHSGFQAYALFIATKCHT